MLKVVDSNGMPLPADTKVTIDGVPGSTRYLQFARPGLRKVQVRAWHNGMTEHVVVPLPIAGTPLTFSPTVGRPPELAMIMARPVLSRPYEVTLSVGTPPRARRSNHAPGGRARPSVRGVPTGFTTRSPLARAVLRAGRDTIRFTRERLTGGGTPSRHEQVAMMVDLTEADIAALARRSSGHPPTYEWDFGDGSPIAVTSVPWVAHNFFDHLDHTDLGVSRFHVECRIPHAQLTVIRTLTMHSAYYRCRQRGIVVPHVTADVFANKMYWLFAGEFTVFNVEDAPLVLDKMAVAALSPDATALGVPSAFTDLTTPVHVTPKSSAKVGVHVPIGPTVPYDAPGFTVWYAGHLGGRAVRLSVTFEVPLKEQKIQPAGPHLPEAWTHTWPWDMVQSHLADIVSNDALVSRIGPPGVTLDTTTGTMAVDLGRAGQTLTSLEVRAAVARVMRAALFPARLADQSQWG
jgi:hypothetical protein